MLYWQVASDIKKTLEHILMAKKWSVSSLGYSFIHISRVHSLTLTNTQSISHYAESFLIWNVSFIRITGIYNRHFWNILRLKIILFCLKILPTKIFSRWRYTSMLWYKQISILFNIDWVPNIHPSAENSMINKCQSVYCFGCKMVILHCGVKSQWVYKLNFLVSLQVL